MSNGTLKDYVNQHPEVDHRYIVHTLLLIDESSVFDLIL
jgi:hypothetical protein